MKHRAGVGAFMIVMGALSLYGQCVIDEHNSALPTIMKRAVTVTSQKRKGYTATCSGFVIETGKVMTAAHCEGPNLLVDNQPATVLKRGEGLCHDCLLVSTKTAVVPRMGIATATAGQMLMEVGNFMGYDHLMDADRVLGYDNNVLLHRALAAPAFSGSGLWDCEGRLLGMNTQYGVAIVDDNGTKHLSIMLGRAVPSSAIKDFLGW